MLDWEKIKFEVDLEQYFLFKQGSMFQFDKYKKAYVENATSKHGDIIRFFKHERTGVKIYYSIVYNDSGDIIQFIKKRILKKIDASALEINQELNNYLGIVPFQALDQPIISKQNSSKLFTDGDSFETNGNIIPKIDQHLDYLLNYRKLDEILLSNPLFNKIFFTYKTGNTESLAFYINDIENKTVGINRIQTIDNEFFNKKWFEKNSKNGIGFTFSDYSGNTETLSIFETVFDAMSFHEIYGLESIQYLSTNGELGFRKAGLIHEYFKNKNFSKLLLCNDNDLAGCYFNLCILAAFLTDSKSVKKSKNNITLEIVETDGEGPTSILKQFFTKSNQKYELQDGSDLPQSYFSETLSSNTILYYFMIGNSKDSILFLIDLLMRLWNLNEFISVVIPTNKDFNEDLIASKNLTNG